MEHRVWRAPPDPCMQGALLAMWGSLSWELWIVYITRIKLTCVIAVTGGGV